MTLQDFMDKFADGDTVRTALVVDQPVNGYGVLPDGTLVKNYLQVPPDWRGCEVRSVSASTEKRGDFGAFECPVLVVTIRRRRRRRRATR